MKNMESNQYLILIAIKMKCWLPYHMIYLVWSCGYDEFVATFYRGQRSSKKSEDQDEQWKATFLIKLSNNTIKSRIKDALLLKLKD